MVQNKKYNIQFKSIKDDNLAFDILVQSGQKFTGFLDADNKTLTIRITKNQRKMLDDSKVKYKIITSNLGDK